ncbi:hypothetical protein ACEQ8H_005677 [Pleosporales sp. CAS-2024a]
MAMNLDDMMAQIDAIPCESTNITQDITDSSASDSCHKLREKLLDSPPVLLVTSYSCTRFDSTHQLSAAKGMVNSNRMRQFTEQADNCDRDYAIEFPSLALSAGSSRFKQELETQPGSFQIPVKMGNILPGYAMCVLDWYAKALQSKEWYEFLPQSPSVEGVDKWYWVYCYAVMQLMGMDQFALRLQEVIASIMCHLITSLDDYAHLLRLLKADDPVLHALAQYTATQMRRPSPQLTGLDCQTIARNFPGFANMVNTFLGGQ